MKYSIYSDAGNHKQRNEDGYILRVAKRGCRYKGMAAVCDGVSSLDDGELASQYVIQRLDALFDQWKLQAIDGYMEIERIHRSLKKLGKQHQKQYGTTLSLFLFEDNHYQIYQVGDSRIYLYHKQLQQITNDQTLAQLKYDEKTISLKEYEESQERHILTQCIGISNQLHIAYDQGEWKQNDGIMLCSDGISNRLSLPRLDTYMKMFLHTSQDQLAKQMGSEAMALGEQDNVTAILYTRGLR